MQIIMSNGFDEVKGMHGVSRLYQLDKRRSYLNLTGGLYGVIKGNSETKCHLSRSYPKSERNLTPNGDQRSYTTLHPAKEDDEYQYYWDSGSDLGESYFVNYGIRFVRELLPFEKIELMFEMHSFLNKQDRTTNRNFQKCATAWNN
ncbi:hypothetical protein VCHA53O466_50135 [Vibrio chagasii]|nr:hypothetical protein VCHA53O466_50135 [Vibrio chagasii]